MWERTHTLGRLLRQRLSGRKLAVLGDSFSRGVFLSLVGLLRLETSFFDVGHFSPARYTLHIG